ncbi:hypothetical protein A2U01_0042223 [Trifolium medium]|uniref:Uncharacterized protein n=1 Tax=Trifolium medium TaxID=97028 RepID=A0A392QB05_9FABA|nr:hypothetical protein [Trifolium medium]
MCDSGGVLFRGSGGVLGAETATAATCGVVRSRLLSSRVFFVLLPLILLFVLIFFLYHSVLILGEFI